MRRELLGCLAGVFPLRLLRSVVHEVRPAVGGAAFLPTGWELLVRPSCAAPRTVEAPELRWEHLFDARALVHRRLLYDTPCLRLLIGVRHDGSWARRLAVKLGHVEELRLGHD